MTLLIIIPFVIIAGGFIIRKVREWQWGWVSSTFSLKGKIFIITGANTGLGFDTTKALVKREATVILACRSMDRAGDAIKRIRGETLDGIMIPIQLDLSSFDSIRKFADKINTQYPTFYCLINNAGLATHQRHDTKDNLEIHFATNHLGHFLLFNLLKENIERNKSRIVIVASVLHTLGNIDFDNLGKFTTPVKRYAFNNPYYNDTKLMNFYFTRELYKKGFETYILCPGMCYTDISRSYGIKWYHKAVLAPFLWFVMRSSEQGAQNIIYCATEDNINTPERNPANGYYIRSLKQSKSFKAFDDNVSERLWRESEMLCGINMPQN